MICNVAERGVRMVQMPSATPSQNSIPSTTSASCSLSTNFNSASELAVALSRLGKIFNILQLTLGPLEGHFSVVHLKDLSILSIQLLLLNSECRNDYICFRLSIKRAQANSHGHSILTATNLSIASAMGHLRKG